MKATTLFYWYTEYTWNEQGSRQAVGPTPKRFMTTECTFLWMEGNLLPIGIISCMPV
jgi:hypothetical protein